MGSHLPMYYYERAPPNAIAIPSSSEEPRVILTESRRATVAEVIRTTMVLAQCQRCFLMHLEGDEDVDQISELPGDIVLLILSSLGMKEVAKTSILSKSFRYFSACQTYLDFDYSLIVPEFDPESGEDSCTLSQRSKYVNWVNQVVRSHCGPSIDMFRVRYCFPSCDADHIDNWVRFAISKRVKNLVLDLISFVSENIVYTLGFDILKPSLCGGGISFLTSLHLKNINVSGDFLEYVLSRCLSLEQLFVERSDILLSLKVIRSSCKLKQLTLRECYKLEELEIHAVNLEYFEYCAGFLDFSPNIVFRSVPALVQASFSIVSSSILQQISGFAMQLTRLSLDLTLGYNFPAEVLPSFCNVKRLEIKVECIVEFDLLAMTRLLEACPVLREFKVEVSWETMDVEKEAYFLRSIDDYQCYEDDERKLLDLIEIAEVQAKHKAHSNLRILEVAAFNGCNADVELILCLVYFSCNLETVICDPHRFPFNSPLAGVIEASRSRATKLRKIIPSNVNIILI